MSETTKRSVESLLESMEVYRGNYLPFQIERLNKTLRRCRDRLGPDDAELIARIDRQLQRMESVR